MAFCRIAFILVVVSVVQCFAFVEVPVFLWGNLAQTSLKSTPLNKVEPSEFRLLLKHELDKDPFTVIFIEETLSVEDFSLKGPDGKTVFPYLQANVQNGLYLPTVEVPLRVLNKFADPERQDHIKLTENGLSAEIQPDSGKYLFINLKDAEEGESRADLLSRHDEFIAETVENLQQKHDSVVAIYTAHNPSWTNPDYHSRVRRQATTGTQKASNRNYELPSLRISFASVQIDVNSTRHNLTYKSGEDVEINGTSLEQNNTLLFSDDTSITLNFVGRMGYWMINSVTVTSKTYNITEPVDLPPQNDIYALLNHCYRCNASVSFAKYANSTVPTYLVLFKDLKVQPYFNETKSIGSWGDSYNCVGFFTAPIWAGLFVVFILLAITFYGIMMMMDIKTMDRFDDPKGKTITIAATE